MGQYFKICNLDKKQCLHSHKFGDGLKLMEFGASGGGTMNGLAILLANSNGRGKGDCRSSSQVIGSWAGDRIVVAGDYGAKDENGATLYEVASETFEDISDAVVAALKDDEAS